MRGRWSLVEMRDRVMLSLIDAAGRQALLCVPHLENRLMILELDQVSIILAEMHLTDNDAADLPGDHASPGRPAAE